MTLPKDPDANHSTDQECSGCALLAATMLWELVVGTSFSTGPSLVMKCNDADPISPSLAVTLCADTNPDMLGGLCLLVDGGYGNWDICDDDMAAG